jgi:hypothetical protein
MPEPFGQTHVKTSRFEISYNWCPPGDSNSEQTDFESAASTVGLGRQKNGFHVEILPSKF